MKFTNYLAFENAIEAGHYYNEKYNGIFAGHVPLTEEMSETYNLPATIDLAQTTMTASLTIFGIEFRVSDRVDQTGDFSDSLNMMLEFGPSEKEKFEQIIGKVQEDSEAKLIYENLQKNELYKMYRFKDKYGILWSLILTK